MSCNPIHRVQPSGDWLVRLSLFTSRPAPRSFSEQPPWPSERGARPRRPRRALSQAQERPGSPHAVAKTGPCLRGCGPKAGLRDYPGL